ncbi:MAG: pyridoxine 5'-phosphate synthase [Flavobacteriales bacterium]|jgi:pyridoxine 5-phosphate synthase
MTKLSVNINKIATLRNARGGNRPDVIEAAQRIESFGADGITVHPRPDERHIRRSDVYALKQVVTTEFNIEGYPSSDFMQMVLEVKPHQVTLVPDPPEAITSNAGWDVLQQGAFLTEIVGQLKEAGIRTSIFLDARPELVAAAAATGTDRIELYTESYAHLFAHNPAEAVAPFVKTAEAAANAGLGVNAGHDLSHENLHYFATHVPGLLEVSIGHALICDALYWGLENTVRLYKRALEAS